LLRSDGDDRCREGRRDVVFAASGAAIRRPYPDAADAPSMADSSFLRIVRMVG
jgi:hypothetical protein